MKKIVSLLGLLLLFSLAIKAQTTLIFSSDFETWYGNAPAGWEGSATNIPLANVLPYTVSSHSPTHACELINSTSTHQRFTTQAIKITNGTIYNISYWVRGHGSIRIGLDDGRASGYGYIYHTYITENSTTWTLVTDTLMCRNTKSSQFIWDVKSTFSDLDNVQIDDIAIYTGTPTTSPYLIITYPFPGSTYYSSYNLVEFNTMNFILGQPGGNNVNGHVMCSVDGGGATPYYSSNPIPLNGLTAASHYAVLQLVDNSGNPLSPNIQDTIKFVINLTAPNPVSIYNIQYTTAAPASSPLNNTVVTTTGVVTATYSGGYFIQDPDSANTWNGLYVYDYIYQPTQGDLVTVTGTVSEYYGYTELIWLSGFTDISQGNALPAPVNVTTANLVDTIIGEPYEGTLVKMINVPCSKLANTYNEWQVFSGGDTANIGGLINQFAPTFGTYYDITGVVYLTYNHYYIEPRNVNDIQVHSGINEFDGTLHNIAIYPNPSQDMIYIKNTERAKTINVINVTGQTVRNIEVSGNTAAINISSLPTGVYFITLMNEKGIINRGRFVKD